MLNWTWAVTVASIIGTIANIYKKRWCFIIWLFTNAIWCVYDLTLGAYAQSALFFLYFWLAVWGLAQWRRSE